MPPVATSGESGVWFGWACLDSAFGSGLLLGAPDVAAMAEALAVARVVGATVAGLDDVVGFGGGLGAGAWSVVGAAGASAEGVSLEYVASGCGRKPGGGAPCPGHLDLPRERREPHAFRRTAHPLGMWADYMTLLVDVTHLTSAEAVQAFMQQAHACMDREVGRGDADEVAIA